MEDPETSDAASQQPQPDDSQRRDPWWSYVLELLFFGGEVVVWLIVGVARVFAWIAAAVLSSCN